MCHLCSNSDFKALGWQGPRKKGTLHKYVFWAPKNVKILQFLDGPTVMATTEDINNKQLAHPL